MNKVVKFRNQLFSHSLQRFFCTRALNYVCDSVDIKLNPSCFIHPTAIVHPNALIGQNQLGAVPRKRIIEVLGGAPVGCVAWLTSGHEIKGVSVGPFCTVGSSAKLGNGCKLYPGSHIFGDTKLGDQCVLMTGAVIGDDLPGRTVFGSNNVIGHHAVVGVKCQDMKYKSGDECFLEVGDNNEIREHASIHRSSMSIERTVIGNNNLIMGSCHVAHDCKIGNNNIFANNTLLAGHVVVEDYAHTAGATVVHQFCRIGSFSFIGGGSVVSQDVPKYMMVTGERAEIRGLNLEGLRRRGFSVTEIKSLKSAYKKIFMPVDITLGGIEDRLEQLEVHEELAHVPAVSSMLQSIRDSFKENRRGICKYRHWSGS